MKKYFPEPDLSRRLSEGDETAFREVFDRFHRRIYHFALGFLKDKDQSEEIVQDTFLHFWLHREKLDHQYPIAPYLFTIARRTVIDAWRKAASAESFRERVGRIMETLHNDTEERIWADDLERIANEGLSRLNEQQQQVFTLSRYEGLSYDEIAERLQISKNTVKYHLVNALKIMRVHFNKHDVMYTYVVYSLFFCQ